MKNIFKSLLVILVAIVCNYVVWAVLYFILRGGWLGAISSNVGTAMYCFTTILIALGMLTYLDEYNYYE